MSIKIKFQNSYKISTETASVYQSNKTQEELAKENLQILENTDNQPPKKRNVFQRTKDFISKKIDDQEMQSPSEQQVNPKKKYRNPNVDTILINEGTPQIPENNIVTPSSSSQEKASAVLPAQIENIINSTNTLSAAEKKRIINAGIGDIKPELLSEIIKKSGGFFKFTKFFRDAKNIELKSSLTKEQLKVIGQTNENDKLEAELVKNGYTQAQIEKIMAPIRELENANSSLSIDQVNKQLDERDLLLQTVLKNNGGLNLAKQGMNALAGGLAATTIGLGFVGSAFASTLGDKWLGNKEKRNELDAIGSLEAGKFDAGMQNANMLMQNIITLESARSSDPLKNPEYLSNIKELETLLGYIEKASISQKSPLSLESFTQLSKIKKALNPHSLPNQIELNSMAVEDIKKQEMLDILNADRSRVETSTNEAINKSMQKLWSKETLVGLAGRLALGATISSVAHAVPHIKGEHLLGVDNQHFAHAADKIQRNGRKLAQENFAQGIDINNPILDKFADFGGWVNQHTQDLRINLFENGGYESYMNKNALTGELNLDGLTKYYNGNIPKEIADQIKPLQESGLNNFRVMQPASAFKEKFDQILAGSMGGLFGLTANLLPRSKMVNPIYQAGTLELISFTNPDITPKSPDLPPKIPGSLVPKNLSVPANKNNFLPFKRNQPLLNPSQNKLIEAGNDIYDGELLEPTREKPKLKGYKTPDDILDGEVIDDNKAINGNAKLMISRGKEQNQNPEIQKLLAAEKKAIEDNNIEAYKNALSQRYILEGKPRDMRLLTPAVFQKITGKPTPPLSPKTERLLITPTTESDDPWISPIENETSQKELFNNRKAERLTKINSLLGKNKDLRFDGLKNQLIKIFDSGVVKLRNPGATVLGGSNVIEMPANSKNIEAALGLNINALFRNDANVINTQAKDEFYSQFNQQLEDQQKFLPKTTETQPKIDDTITAEILEPLPIPKPKQIGQEQE